MSNRSPNLKALKQTAWFAAILVLVSTCIFGLFVGAGSWMTRNAGKLSDEAKVQRTRSVPIPPADTWPALDAIQVQRTRSVPVPLAVSQPARVPVGFVKCRDNGDCGGSWYAAVCDTTMVQDFYALAECNGRRSEWFIRKFPVPSDVPPGFILCEETEHTQLWSAECPILDSTADYTIISRWFSNVYADVYPEYGNWVVDFEDIVFVIQVLGEELTDPSDRMRADIWPCEQTETDGDVVDFDDLVSVIEAFQGNARCP